MSHEPECESPDPADKCIDCDIIRAAYKRGREDAARNIAHSAVSNWAAQREENEAIRRVRDLHQKAKRYTDTVESYVTTVCDYCDDTWPCDTICALDGEQA